MVGVRDIPLVKPLVLERSRSKVVDSRSTPDRTLSGSLVTNSLLSEFTEYLRLSRVCRLPTRPPSFASNGDFGLDPSISGSQQQSNQPNSRVSLSAAFLITQPNCFHSSVGTYIWYLDFLFFSTLCYTVHQYMWLRIINVVWGLFGSPMITVLSLTSASSKVCGLVWQPVILNLFLFASSKNIKLKIF